MRNTRYYKDMMQLDFKFEAGNKEKYKVKDIHKVEDILSNTIFAKKSQVVHFLARNLFS